MIHRGPRAADKVFRGYTLVMARQTIRSTTVLSVRRDARVAMAADGQVTIGATVAKADAVKVRLLDGVGAEQAGVLAYDFG